MLAEDDSVTLLAYPLAVGCASVSAVKQETEAVLQVRPAALPRVTNLFGQPKGLLTISQNEISSPQMENHVLP